MSRKVSHSGAAEDAVTAKVVGRTVGVRVEMNVDEGLAKNDPHEKIPLALLVHSGDRRAMAEVVASKAKVLDADEDAGRQVGGSVDLVEEFLDGVEIDSRVVLANQVVHLGEGNRGAMRKG